MDDLIDATLELEHILTVPPITARETIELARDLLAASPASGDPELARVALALGVEIEATEVMLAELAELHDPEIEEREVAIESLTDHLWAGLLTSLHGWSVFLLPGTAAVMRASEEVENFEDTQARARRALVLYEALFPPEERGFLLRPPYHRQAQTLEAFTRLVSGDVDWVDAREIVGKTLWPLIPLMQHEHQRFVSSGHWRRREGPRLMAQRAVLRHRIARHNNRVILTFLDPADAASHGLVRDALAPIDRLRERLKLFRSPLDVDKAMRAAIRAEEVFVEAEA